MLEYLNDEISVTRRGCNKASKTTRAQKFVLVASFPGISFGVFKCSVD